MLSLVVCLAACLAVAFFGGRFTPGDWYAQLSKPAWTPPNAVFAPVWTVLYVTMAVAAWLAWRERGFVRAWPALSVFVLQLLLNAAWSWIFFGRHRPGLAFAEIVVLWSSILAALVLFWRIRPLAGALLVPYLAWVSFAAVLNFSLWRLNL